MEEKKCRKNWIGFTIHNYGSWDVLERGKVETCRYRSGLRGETGNYLVQQRKCKDCGFLDLNHQQVSLN